MTSREQADAVIAAVLGNHALASGGSIVYISDEQARHIAIDVRAALLAARVPCPTCSGTRTVLVTLPPPFQNRAAKDEVPCPDCDDGRGGPLVLLAPVEVGEVIGDPVTGFRQRALGGPITNARIAYVAGPENEER